MDFPFEVGGGVGWGGVGWGGRKERGVHNGDGDRTLTMTSRPPLPPNCFTACRASPPCRHARTWTTLPSSAGAAGELLFVFIQSINQLCVYCVSPQRCAAHAATHMCAGKPRASPRASRQAALAAAAALRQEAAATAAAAAAAAHRQAATAAAAAAAARRQALAAQHEHAAPQLPHQFSFNSSLQLPRDCPPRLEGGGGEAGAVQGRHRARQQARGHPQHAGHPGGCRAALPGVRSISQPTHQSINRHLISRLD